MLELGILLQNQKDQQNMHYQDIKAVPMVYSGIYPVDGAKYDELREALEKLQNK